MSAVTRPASTGKARRARAAPPRSTKAKGAPPRVEPWFVYVLRCADGTYYTGIARDVAARLAAHRAGKGAKYTRGRGPLVLLAKAPCEGRSGAQQVEAAIKALPRKEKLAATRRLARDAKAKHAASKG